MFLFDNAVWSGLFLMKIFPDAFLYFLLPLSSASFSDEVRSSRSGFLSLVPF